MTALAFQPVQAANRRAKVLLIGEAGTGKTHASLTFPRPVVIDAEGSADWFADRFAFEAVPTKSYSDVRTLLEQVRTKRVNCETVIIDSLTTIYNGLVNAATIDRMKQGSDDLRPLDWGRIKRKFSSLLDELYHQLPVNVVCIGWIKPEYAKTGDKVNGQIVKPNDLVKLGETFDGDRKTLYAFDFVLKILGNDGTRTKAEVIKSRSGKLKQGQVINDFSWKTLEALLPKGEGSYRGMTDEEQGNRDDGILDQPVPPRTPRPASASEAGKPVPSPAAEASHSGATPILGSTSGARQQPRMRNSESPGDHDPVEKGQALDACMELKRERHLSDAAWQELLREMVPHHVSAVTQIVSEGDLSVQELREVWKEAHSRTKA
jgi:hypothetical protein